MAKIVESDYLPLLSRYVGILEISRFLDCQICAIHLLCLRISSSYDTLLWTFMDTKQQSLDNELPIIVKCLILKLSVLTYEIFSLLLD